MNAVLKALLEVTLYSSAIAGILLFLRALFKKKISIQLQYAAWMLLILRLLMPVTMESGVHFFTVEEKSAVVETVAEESRAESVFVSEAPAYIVPQTVPTVQSEAQTAPAKPQENHAPLQAEKKPLLTVTWQQVVFAVWIMGALMLGGFFLCVRIRFVKKLHFQLPTDAMRMEYDRICGEMRLRRAPVLAVCDVESPALLGRKILLPEGLSEQALRYALLHELTHYERKDHITVAIMSALRCVYWFNPLVWIAFRAMQEDMEIACDAGVLRRIGTEEKGGYLMTLLKMFSSHTAPAVGMAQAGSKRAAKARIEGAFRKKRTGRSMRVVSAMIACLIFICCFTTACQPTPEAPPVVNKNDGKLEEKIEESHEEEVEIVPIEIPEKWTETYQPVENVTITIDVPIEGGDLSEYPVAEVRSKELTEEQIDRFVDYFAAGKKFFANEETKADMLRLLMEAKKGTEVDGEIVPPDPEYIKSLEEKIAAMPDDRRNYIEPILTPLEYGGLALHAGVELGDGEDATLSVTKIGKYGNDSYLGYHRGGVIGEALAQMNHITLKTPSVSKEDAIKAAEQTIADLGFTDMVLSTIIVGEMNPSDWGPIHSEYRSNGYLMTFTREVNGMAMVDVTNGEGGFGSGSGGSSPQYQPAYRAPWTPEYILIYADENGVQNFSYSNQAETTEVVSENVQLLPLEEIAERAMKQIYYKDALLLADLDRTELTVSRVVLGGSLINKKNELDTGIIVPAWHFYYSGMCYDEDLKNGSMEFYEKMIVINAIDGSVIDALYMPEHAGEG